METSVKDKNPEVDYEKYIVRRSVEDYWRAEEKVELILTAMAARIPVTTLCKLNNVSPSQFYEWREKFLARGKEGLLTNGGRSQREAELEKKINILERCIGELTLEKELLKKMQN